MAARDDDGGPLAFACLMAASTIVAAAALTPLRHVLGAPNIALLLAVLVGVAGFVGGRLAGGLAGIVAALSFNFFHAPPYLTLRVSDVHDVLTIVLIALIGAGAGELGAQRAHRRFDEREQRAAVHGLESVSALVASGAAPNEVLDQITRELGELAGVSSVRFAAEPATEIPLLSRNGHIDTAALLHSGRGFTLPAAGIRAPVVVDGAVRGDLVVAGTSHAVTVEQRRIISAMADQLALAWRGAPATR
jgi:K+-sensing histidine kinase KdpD